MKISTDVGKNTVHKLGWESSIKQCWGPWESNAPDFKVSNFNRPFLRKIPATTSFRTNTSEKTNTSEQWAFDLWPDSAERNNSLNVCFSTDVCKKLTNCIAHTSSTVLAVPLLILTRLAPRGGGGAPRCSSPYFSEYFLLLLRSCPFYTLITASNRTSCRAHLEMIWHARMKCCKKSKQSGTKKVKLWRHKNFRIRWGLGQWLQKFTSRSFLVA